MNVADAMTPRSELVTVSIPGSRDDVLEYLQEYGFSSVPVVKEADGEEVYRGLVSRDDLIERPDEDQLALLMGDVPTVRADVDIREAAARMVEEHARRLPVVGEGETPVLEGILTVTDVVRAIGRGEVDGEREVGELATPDVNATYVGTPLTVAEREIFFANVPYAIALDETGDMAGILTEVDIVRVARVVRGEEETGESFADQDDDWMWESVKAVGSTRITTRNVEIPSEPVREFMTEDVVTASNRWTAKKAAREMISRDIEQIPLVNGGDLVGIVRDIDLLRGI